jgi:nucleoside-diphosphate-sugar epimerase
LTNVYGPGEAFDNIKKGAFNYLIRRAQLGEPLHVYGGGDFFRDYLYIDDAVEALVAVAERGAPGELYLAGYGKPVMFRDLIDTLHRLTNRKSPIDAIEPPHFHQVMGIRNFSADITKISALGWSPQVGFEAGLQRTLEAYGS